MAATLSEPAQPKLSFPYLTSHDLIKSFAVIIMIIDHFGEYFEPHELGWRAIGRIGFPVWFFLIGYARSRSIGWKLLGGATVLVVANLLSGMVFLPLNALWSIIFIRLSLDFITRKIGSSETKLFLFTLLLLALYPILNGGWEYGSLAFIFALSGYYKRNGFGEQKIIPVLYGIFALISFIYIQQAIFDFTLPLLAFMTAGTVGVMALLFYYLPKQGPAITTQNPLIRVPLMGMGRYTLEIYVAHLLLFKLVYFVLHGCSASICLLQLI